MPAEGAAPDRLIGGLRDRILADFPGQIRSLYLLGSRALGRQIETSDLDLAVIFKEGGAEKRRAVAEWLGRVRRDGGPMLDATVLVEEDYARGVRPYLQIARLLAGEDVLKDRPLKPAEEVTAYYAHLAAYFIWAVRGRPAALRYPLEYPEPEGEFFGYERYGIRVGDSQYGPGFSQLVNCVSCVATFRLADLAGEFFPNKSMMAAAYARCFPADPWLDLVTGVYELGRVRSQGRLPAGGAERRQLAEFCRRTLAFENEGLGACLLLLPRIAALADPDLRQRVRGIVERTEHLLAGAGRAAPGRGLRPRMKPRISVIIPVHNGAHSLGACLGALESQTLARGDEFEVIVVDNGSTDELADTRRLFPGVRWLEEAAPGSYAARNRGLRQAAGEIIAFTDADCLPDAAWLRQGVAALAAGPATVVGGEVPCARSGRPRPELL